MGQNKMPEMLPADVGTFLSKNKDKCSISRQSTTFQEIFIFQLNLPLTGLGVDILQSKGGGVLYSCMHTQQ